MANNRKTTRGRKQNEEFTKFEGTQVRTRKQVVYSEPQRILKERYLSPKGEILLNSGLIQRGMITKEQIWEKYGKNRYIDNPNAKPVKTITHVLT